MFRQHLQTLVNKIEGCRAALLVGSDGLIVDSWTMESDRSLELIAAQGSQFLRSGLAMLEAISADELKELVLVSETQKLLLRAINSSYFIVLLLSENSVLGQARYHLHAAESAFAVEIG